MLWNTAVIPAPMSVYHKREARVFETGNREHSSAVAPITDDFVLVCDGPLNDGLDAMIATKQQEMGEILNIVALRRTVDLAMH